LRDSFEGARNKKEARMLVKKRCNVKSASGNEARESLASDRASGDALRVAPQVQDEA